MILGASPFTSPKASRSSVVLLKLILLLFVSLRFICTMNVFSPTGDVVIRNGDEMILTDKNGRRFRKAEHASSASAHVSRKRLNFREPLVLCLLLTQENK